MRKVAMVALASMFLVAPTVVMAETSNTNNQPAGQQQYNDNSVTVCMMDVITEVIVDNVAI
ncbi:TPA: hypothetical protein ACKRXQ_001252 [Proteus mirabilis]